MIQILNNMTSDYCLQLAIMEKRVNDKVNPFTINEISHDLNLYFEKLSMEASEENEIGIVNMGIMATITGEISIQLILLS
jgi:hypothetical protein